MGRRRNKAIARHLPNPRAATAQAYAERFAEEIEVRDPQRRGSPLAVTGLHFGPMLEQEFVELLGGQSPGAVAQ